jgi:3,4-dihydroxy 2-butanone 4-phosphate synthase/GTP cyclohydrolase II
MVEDNTETHGTAFTVSVDLSRGVTTGISAADRAATLRALADPAATASDFRRPGHIFPLRYREGGVLERPGHTEAVIDLARMAGCRRAGTICELVNDDGTMQRLPDLHRFARRHAIPLISIADLIAYRLERDGAPRNASTFLADARI